MRSHTLLLALALAGWLPFHARTAENDHWDDHFGGPGADGIVLTTTVVGSDVYVGGKFESVGEAKSVNIARWDGGHWHSLGGGLSGDIGVVSAIVEHNGDIFVRGNFTTGGGASLTNLAKWNGSSWADVGGGVRGAVIEMLFVGSDLYVAGSFTQAGSINATNIARWDGKQWHALGPGLDVTTGFFSSVAALALGENGELFAAGDFRQAGTLLVNGVARWDGNQWHALQGGVTGGVSPTVRDLIVRGTDLIVAGTFSAAGGVNATNVARWDGQQWHAMGGGPKGSFDCLASFSNELYVGGSFTNVAGVPIRGVARWDGARWQALAPTGGEVYGTTYGLAAGTSALYAAGDFTLVGNASALGVAQWNGTAWSGLASARSKGVYLGSRTVAVVGSDVILGGSFITAGGKLINRIARWDGSEWNDLGGGVVGSGNVFTILEHDGMVYVGGSFTNVGGVNARSVAMWDGANWQPLASGLNSNVTALTFFGGELYAGGTFNRRGDRSGSFYGLAKWDGADWAEVPGLTAGRMNNAIRALATDGTLLYVGGDFLLGWEFESATHICSFDGSNWSSLGAGLNTNVNALAVSEGRLFAGGGFTTSGALRLNRVASWDGTEWSSLASGLSNGSVNALAVSGSRLYAVGSFTNASGTDVNRIARWNGVAWSPLGSGITMQSGPANPSVTGLAAAGDDLYVAGLFTAAGGRPSFSIARWNENLIFGPPAAMRLRNPRWLGAGQFQLDLDGLQPGAYAVERSVNLRDWSEVHSGDAADPTFLDAAAPGNAAYYRVRQP